MSPDKVAARPKKPRRRRAARRGPRASYAKVTYALARAAAAQGAAVRARQAEAIGRARPANRDPALIEVRIRTRLVRAGAKVIDRDPSLVSWLAERVEAAQRGPGRPGVLSLRTALICYWLLAVTKRDFHLVNLPELLAALHWRVRRQLGIDYLDSSGAARQLSYGQLLRVFHNVADALDPFADGLDDDEAARRAADLQELANRLVRASIEPGNLVHNGDYAVDATLKWSWDRPRRGRNGKIERRGRDGDAGRPLSLSQVVDLDEGGIEGLEEVGFVRDSLTTMRRADRAREPADDVEEPDDALEESGEEPITRKKRARRSRARTWGGGSAWVGRKPATKSVFGIALHTVTLTDPTRPALVEAMVVTPAPALPSQATIPLLAMLGEQRAGTATPLGHVVADPLYSMHPPDWQLPLRALGALAIFRLHRGTNQEGKHAYGHDLFIDGRPYCECAHDALPDLRYPPYLSSPAVMEEYQAQVMLRRPFEMLPNGPFRANGDRQFLYPHHNKDSGRGGCAHCVHADGSPVVDPETGRPKPTCCRRQTKLYKAPRLGLYQCEPFGEPSWYECWNPRDRVEGDFGALKNLALVNWGQNFHHFVGVARETLVAAFALMALNFHLQRTWTAKLNLIDEKAKRGGRPMSRPSAQPTATTPAGLAAAKRRQRAAEAEASKKGPAGLDFASTPIGGP